jgi:hypothetical protein
MASKCTKDAGNISALLVMVSIGALKRKPAGQTVYENESTVISFDPPLFSLEGNCILLPFISGRFLPIDLIKKDLVLKI